jgi:hypothetical protein
MPDIRNTPSFTMSDLEQWVEQGLITPDQLRGIRRHIELAGPAGAQPQGPEQRKGLNLITVAYYFGAFMVLLAYTIFMGLQWESLGNLGQLAVSGLTIGVLWAIGYLLRRGGFKVAGGLLIFAGTGIAPLFFYSVQRATGLWPSADSAASYSDFYQYVSADWIVMECASLLVAILVMWRVRFPLLSLLIAFWTWYLSMDLSRLIFGTLPYQFTDRQHLLGIFIGAAMLLLGVVLQRRARQDYSLWFYLFGHLIILGQLSALALEREGWLGLAYLVLYLLFVVASIWLQRRIFLVFGAIGCYGYLSYLAFHVFSGGLGFVLALGSLGLMIVLTAVGYQKYARRWLERGLGQYQLAKP